MGFFNFGKSKEIAKQAYPVRQSMLLNVGTSSIC
jgi:hypothetical protein